MKNLIIIGLILGIAYYFFNNRVTNCETIEDVQDKGLELAQAFMHAATAKNSSIDAEALMKRIKKVEVMKDNGFPDIQKACVAMDEIMDELDY